MQRRAPSAGGGVAGEAGRHDEDDRLPRGERGERGQPFERPRVGPVDVLDRTSSGERAARGRQRESASIEPRSRAAVLIAAASARSRASARPRADRGGRGAARRRARARRLRAPIRCRRASSSALAASPSRLRARLRIASRPVSEPKSSTVPRCRRSRAPPRCWRTRRSAATCRRPGSPRTTTTRPRLRSAQAVDDGAELAQLLVAADDGPAAGRGSVAGAADPHRDERLLLALDLGRDAGSAVEEVRHLAPGRFADDDLAGRSEAAQARRRVHRVAGQRVAAARTSLRRATTSPELMPVCILSARAGAAPSVATNASTARCSSSAASPRSSRRGDAPAGRRRAP